MNRRGRRPETRGKGGDPGDVLAAYDRMNGHEPLDGEAIELALRFEWARMEAGLPEDVSREELEAAARAAWGRKGGLRTLELYERDHFRALAKRRSRRRKRESLPPNPGPAVADGAADRRPRPEAA